ncbi:hypothetical protein [Pseudomonas veronii]|uniref:hypothetical protein n=1 Tax=Pseudomonas veronii TaxID=76761 RepID=UPI001CA42AFB|nr:hypothetical protein [Pseudomonas veronii]
MKYSKTLPGTANSSIPTETLLQYAKYLASEIITVTHGSRSYAASIIENWEYSDGNFEFTFPEEALDYRLFAFKGVEKI